MIIPYKARIPVVGAQVFIAPDAWVIGDVELADNVTVLFGAVVRGDINKIRVGRRSNVQDLSVIHTSVGRWETVLGEEVTVGHRAVLHGCHIGDRVLIGMGSILLDESVIGDECVVGAGAVVTERKRFPARSMILGAPARVVRELTDEEIRFLSVSAARYVEVGATYLAASPLAPTTPHSLNRSELPEAS